jgi:precorrin-6A/cobalt-precorrin-6A reductase
VLGGTGEARELVEQLTGYRELSVEITLARGGGFDGVAGLSSHLRSGGFDALVDATHPFASAITSHAVAAAAATGVPLLVLRRPSWIATSGDDWRRVPSFAAAAEAVAALEPQVVFLAIGRRELAAFADLDRHTFVLRMIEPLSADEVAPPSRSVLLARGPFELAAERALLRAHDVGVIVTKDSGGSGAAAKLEAARELGRPVIMIDRPSLPDGVAVVSSVSAALSWLHDV